VQILPLEDGLRREFTPISEIPEAVRKSFIEAEDKRFFFHFGVDLIAVARAFFQNVSGGRKVSGASTITMQLARMVSPSDRRDIFAKVKDSVNAVRIEGKLSKKRILELYLNNVPFGKNCEGVTTTARTFYQKELSELTADEIREYRGTLTEPGKNDPGRDRSVEENLRLFEEMKSGKVADGAMTLRAKIDMASPNINMRDPIIYRVAHMTHARCGDKWCIYPMYDFAHPIEDAIEGITHSLCTLEFEDHRPLYDWVKTECEYKNPPRQIEFAKMYLNNVVTGKRYIKKLVEDGIVDGWDDPRLVTIASLRRRGFTPESIKMFVDMCGISKAQATAEYAMLEYCIREDLKLKAKRMLAVLDPVKLIIDNYPEGETEYLEIENNKEVPEMGSRKIPFGKELWIEREDFMEEPPKKYFRLFPGNEVRLMNAYFVTCTGFEKDENGNITEIHCTYDPETKGGDSADGRKVKGTIHWVAAKEAVDAEVRLYENIIDEEKGVYNEDGSLNLNPNSIKVIKNAKLEPELANAKVYEKFQFVRNGFFCVDCKDSKEGAPVFNRIVSLKSSFVLPKN